MKNSLSEQGILVIELNFSEILIKGKGILFELAGLWVTRVQVIKVLLYLRCYKQQKMSFEKLLG